MTSSKSTQKSLRQTEKKTLINKRTRSAMRTWLRKLREAVEAKDKKKAQGLLSLVYKKIDKASGGGCIHANTAARRKAMAMRWFNSLGA